MFLTLIITFSAERNKIECFDTHRREFSNEHKKKSNLGGDTKMSSRNMVSQSAQKWVIKFGIQKNASLGRIKNVHVGSYV